MDITYVPMARGFVYLAAVVDWFSRRVLSWRVSITLEAAFCIEALEEALARHGRPEVFNTDQGSQFTSSDFTDVLLKAGIATRRHHARPCGWLRRPSHSQGRGWATHLRTLALLHLRPGLWLYLPALARP
jgi:transposase InsO family protein